MAAQPNLPDVPDVPGVPQLPRDRAAARPPPPPFLEQDSVESFGRPDAIQWGIFLDGEPVVVADSVIGMEYRQDWSLSTYPVEQGAFQSYNKVQTPFALRVRMATGGNETDRDALLESVEQVTNSILLYEVVTPERTYLNVNLMHYDYHRAASNGVGLISVDIWGEEIRSTAVETFTQTKSPAGASAVNTGTVQTTNPGGALILKNPSGQPLILQGVQ